MDWLTTIEMPSFEQWHWAVIYPRFIVNAADLTLHSGDIYKVSTTRFIDETCLLYQATATEVNATNLTWSSTLAGLSDGEFFYDEATQFLYVHQIGGGLPVSVVVEHALRFSTNGGNFYQDPANADTNTRALWHEGLIIKPPVFNQGYAGQFLGFLPSQTTTLICSNASNYFNAWLYDSYFKNIRCHIWHDVGPKTEDDSFQRVYNGYVTRFSWNKNQITFTCNTFNVDVQKDMSLTKISNVPGCVPDPVQKDFLVRRVYGYSQQFLPLNYNFNETPSTSNNREWIIHEDSLTVCPQLLGVPVVVPSANNTDTTTELTSVAGLHIDDTARLYCNAVAQYVTISAVNYNTNLITHDSIPGRTSLAGDTLSRGAISNAFFGRTTGLYPTTHSLKFLRDWNETSQDGFLKMTLTSTAEANSGLGSAFDPSTDQLAVIAYGTTVSPKYSDNTDVSPVSVYGGTINNPVAIAYDLLSDASSLVDFSSTVDKTNFAAVVAATTETMGIAIPAGLTSSQPKYVDVILDCLNIITARLYYSLSATDNAGPYLSIYRVGQFGPADWAVTKEDIVDFSYEHSADDVPITLIATAPIGAIFTPPNGTNVYTGNNPVIGSVCGSSKIFEITHYADVTTGTAVNNAVGENIFSMLYDRTGLLTITVGSRFFTADLGDVVEIERDALPGFEFSYGTAQTRKFSIIEISKGFSEVTLVLDDQKGIESL
jgi:hypothetical protein